MLMTSSLYLGSAVNSSNNLHDEINQRIGKVLTNFRWLSSRVWENHHLTIKLKIRVYTTCILSVLLYSSETWCRYCCQENWVNAFHFRCLRSILVVLWRDHVPNSTILHLTGSYDLTTIIRQQRLRWLGHVHCMEDGHLHKDILYGEFYRTPQRTGRPKLRHKDVIKRDAAKFHISPQLCETLAADRNRWHASLSYDYSLSAMNYAKKCRSTELIVVIDEMGHDGDDVSECSPCEVQFKLVSSQLIQAVSFR